MRQIWLISSKMLLDGMDWQNVQKQGSVSALLFMA